MVKSCSEFISCKDAKPPRKNFASLRLCVRNSVLTNPRSLQISEEICAICEICGLTWPYSVATVRIVFEPSSLLWNTITTPDTSSWMM